MFKKAKKELQKAGQKIEKEVNRAATDVHTFAQSAGQMATIGDGIYYHIKDHKLSKIPDSLAKRAPANIAFTVLPSYTLSPLELAASKAAIEVEAFIDHGKPLDGSFEPHAKIATLLMVYDYCVRSSIPKDQLITRIEHAIEEQYLAFTTEGKVKQFITQLLLNYSVDGNEYRITMPGFSINGLKQFAMDPNGVAKLTLIANRDNDICTVSNIDTSGSHDPYTASVARDIPSTASSDLDDKDEKDKAAPTTTTTESTTQTQAPIVETSVTTIGGVDEILNTVD